MISSKLLACVRQISVMHVNVRRYHAIPHKKKRVTVEFFKELTEKYQDLLTQPSGASKGTWEDMRKYVMESEYCPLYVDSLVFEIFKWAKRPNAGICYYRFLENSNYDVPVSVICKYLQLYDLKQDPLSEAEKAHVSSLCENIMNKYSSYDAEMSNNLIQSLCKIGNWEEAIKILESFEAADNFFLRPGYTSLIAYFFLHQQVDLGHKYLIHSFKMGTGPKDIAYSAYLQYCLKDRSTFNENVEKLFELWNMYGIKPSKGTIYNYKAACNQLGWSAKSTTISRSTCNTCKQTLSSINLTDEDYKRLCTVTEKKLITDQMYYVTCPKEIKHFTQFVNKLKPFDVIIDGLNFVHCVQFGYRKLEDCLRFYRNEGKKVLVIGRKHMMKRFKRPPFKDLAYYYFVEDMSKDDAFILYSAFSSGKNAKVISEDLMRNHKFAIKDAELDTLFKKWQVSQQYTFECVLEGIKKLNTSVPIDAIVQKQDNCWHIPYIDSDSSPRRRHTCDTDWACFNMCSN